MKIAAKKLNTATAQFIIRLYISTFSRGVEPFTLKDAEVCLRIVAPIPTSWYLNADHVRLRAVDIDCEMLRLWTSFLENSLAVLPRQSAVPEEMRRLTRASDDPTRSSMVESPQHALSRSKHHQFIRLSLVPAKLRDLSLDLYLAQLRVLVQAIATRYTLPTWRSAMEQVLDVADGLDRLLVIPAEPYTLAWIGSIVCIPRLLGDLKQLQGAGARDGPDFQLYERVRRISPDSDGDVNPDVAWNVERSVVINGELWVLKPCSDSWTIAREGPRGGQTLLHLSWKRCAGALADTGRRLRCITDHGDAVV